MVQLVEALRYKPEGCVSDWDFFHCLKLFDRNMAPSLTLPLTEMSTRYIFWRLKAAGA
jgi:hypothetical protein